MNDESDRCAEDAEVVRMAAFNVESASKRIAVLAQSASSELLRRRLLALAQRLEEEGHALRREAKGHGATLCPSVGTSGQ